MKLEIKTNFPSVAKRLAELEADLGNRVMARTLNRTVDIAKTDMSREIRSEFALPAAYVRERLTVRRASAKRGGLRLEAELRGGRKGRRSANVIAFKATQVRKGVAVTIKRGQRKTIGGAFIGNAGRTVFRREGRARLPIKPVQTIEVAQMFNTRRVNAAVVRAINTKLPQVFARELRFALLKFSQP